MDEPGDSRRRVEDGAFWRAHPYGGAPAPVTICTTHAASSVPIRVARCVIGTVAVLVLLLCTIQVRAGVHPGELVADPTHLLDLSVASRRWSGDQADHAGSFAFGHRDASGPLRWPCGSTIRWAYNPAGVDDAAIADLREAVARVSEASGIPFLYVRTTDLVPTSTSQGLPDVDLVVAWATPEVSDVVASDGDGTTLAVTRRSRRGAVITETAVVVNQAEADGYEGGFGRGLTRGKVLLHELGHVVGLDHVDDRTQLMAAGNRRNHPAAFGAGDLTGLAIAGCR